MKPLNILLFPFLVFNFSSLNAQHQLRNGDLLFQNLDCGELCDAIKVVTNGWRNKKFSHMGVVELNHDTIYVWESMGAGVRQILLDSFMRRNDNYIYIGRVKNKYRKLIPLVIDFMHSKDGVLYDDAFLYNNKKYYCSELVYDAFKSANGEEPFFKLEPMTFKQPGSNEYFPVWVLYYRNLNVEIPEGKPGCNPGGISRSKKIRIVGHL